MNKYKFLKNQFKNNKFYSKFIKFKFEINFNIFNFNIKSKIITLPHKKII
jgi:hypothetical protein